MTRSSGLPSPPRGGGGFSVALGVVSVGLATLVVLLAWQNLSLKRQLAAASSAAAESAFAPGDRIGPLAAYGTDGARVTILDGTSERRTLLLIFTSTCPACKATFPAWRELAAHAMAADIDVVALRLDGVPGDDPSIDLPPDLSFPVYAPDPGDPGALRRVQSVPATVLLDAAGAVAASWTGTLDAAGTRAVERALDAG